MLFIVEVVLKELKEYFRNAWLAILKYTDWEIKLETGHFFVHNKYTHKTEGDTDLWLSNQIFSDQWAKYVQLSWNLQKMDTKTNDFTVF